MNSADEETSSVFAPPRTGRRSADAAPQLRPRRLPDPVPPRHPIEVDVQRYYLCCEEPSGEFVEVIVAVSDSGRRRYFATTDGAAFLEVDDAAFARRNDDGARSLLELNAREIDELEAELEFVRPVRGRDPLAELAAAEAAEAAAAAAVAAAAADAPAAADALAAAADAPFGGDGESSDIEIDDDPLGLAALLPKAGVPLAAGAEPAPATSPAPAPAPAPATAPASSTESERGPMRDVFAAFDDSEIPAWLAEYVEYQAAVADEVVEPEPEPEPVVAEPAEVEAEPESAAVESEPADAGAESAEAESAEVAPAASEPAAFESAAAAPAEAEPTDAEPEPTVAEPEPTVAEPEPEPIEETLADSAPAEAESEPDPTPAEPANITADVVPVDAVDPDPSDMSENGSAVLADGDRQTEETVMDEFEAMVMGLTADPQAPSAPQAAPAAPAAPVPTVAPMPTVVPMPTAAPVAAATAGVAPASGLLDASAQVALAKGIAFVAHRGQLDRTGAEYIDHPGRVAEQFDAATDPVAAAAAWLHDVLEDSEMTAHELLNAGVLPEVVDAVETLTRRPEASETEYYGRIARHELARRVKLADIADNAAPWRLRKLDFAEQARLVEKYRHAREALGA